ncbi:MAG: hypothetical protein JNK38_04725 [Acidobacteria bacterium]|nr:hypothetical protein [Acidobacteriota bacterium]
MNRMNRCLFVRRVARTCLHAIAGVVICLVSVCQIQAQSSLHLTIGRLMVLKEDCLPVGKDSTTQFDGESGATELLNENCCLANVASEPETDDEKKKQAAHQPPADSLPQPPQDERWSQTPLQFNWQKALKQSTIFLGIQHGFRLATEEGTRKDLAGPFFKDYFKALKSLRGWDDGDPFIVNYIGHPMMGSVSGYIQIQNDPKGIHEEVSLKRSYWISRLKATAWSFTYSTQFELGLVSEATLGNIGIRPYGKAKHPMAYVDLVVTPVVGTGWLVGEDLLDKYFVRRFEDRMPNRLIRVLFRSFLNPTRSFANILRGEKPWYRDNRR